MLELGSHVSAAGGVDKSVERASSLNMTAAQIFTKNANQWAAKPLDPAVIGRFLNAWHDSNIRYYVAHDSYLINIASPDSEMREKSRLALMDELDRCDQLGIPYLVSHPGAHKDGGVDAGINRVSVSINAIHRERPDSKCMLLLETTAGQGTTLGSTFEELATMIAGLDDKSRVGVCFDTCHVFAAGYELRDQESYDATIADFDRLVGLDNLKVFHLNDSQKGLGAHVDRHAHIGQGQLGLEPFRFLMNDPRFNGLPGILETPKDEDMAQDLMNLDTLTSLVE